MLHMASVCVVTYIATYICTLVFILYTCHSHLSLPTCDNVTCIMKAPTVSSTELPGLVQTVVSSTELPGLVQTVVSSTELPGLVQTVVSSTELPGLVQTV